MGEDGNDKLSGGGGSDDISGSKVRPYYRGKQAMTL